MKPLLLTVYPLVAALTLNVHASDLGLCESAALGQAPAKVTVHDRISAVSLALQSIDSESPQWIKFSSKAPPTATADARRPTKEQKIYRANLKAAVQQVFLPWLARDGKPEPFSEMLRQMHKTIALGTDGISSYSVGEKYRTNQILPGQTRGEIALMDPDSKELTRIPHKFNPILFQFSDGLTELVAEVNKTAKAQGGNPPTPHNVSVRKDNISYTYSARLTFAANGSLDHIQWKNQLDGIVEPGAQINEVYLDSGRLFQYPKHRAPSPLDLAKYISKGEERMRKLLSLPLGAAHRAEFLEVLADYYQVMINAHPFVRINNSLLMAQVNTLLMTNGMEPVFHEDLDILALGLDSREFRRLFLNFVGAKI